MDQGRLRNGHGRRSPLRGIPSARTRSSRRRRWSCPDTTQDPRFAGNDIGLGFYAGTPVTVGGQRIGTLCVAGEEPHTPSDDDLETLRVLASAVTAHVELARRERERADEATMLRRLGEATSRLARVSDASEFETELCAAACELAGADAAVLWTAVPGGMLLAVVDVGLGIAGTNELPAGARRGHPRGVRPRRTRLPDARSKVSACPSSNEENSPHGHRPADLRRARRPVRRATHQTCRNPSCS